MNESFESPKEFFKYPDIEAERGEFERVAHTFNVDEDTLMFLAKEEGRLTPLNNGVWNILENTDSTQIGKGDWDDVKACSEAHTPVRDWEKLKTSLEQKKQEDAPIIIKVEDTYHLVSGNTRLMVSRALGITPQVLIFEYKHDRTDE